MSAQLNGHAAREQLALEVQKEALRPTPPLNGPSLQERITALLQRIQALEKCVSVLREQKRVNRAQFQREIAKQRKELGIRDA